eukprot:scaffold10069_cov69-Cylindrotheca_fusiformis.AAC.15
MRWMRKESLVDICYASVRYVPQASKTKEKTGKFVWTQTSLDDGRDSDTPHQSTWIEAQVGDPSLKNDSTMQMHTRVANATPRSRHSN